MPERDADPTDHSVIPRLQRVCVYGCATCVKFREIPCVPDAWSKAENHKTGIKESSHVRKASLNIPQIKRVQQTCGNTHWRKILIFQFLSINYWVKSLTPLLLTGVKALQLLEEQGKKDSQVLLKDTVIQKNGTLVSSGCHRKIPQTGWLKVQKFIFSQFGKLDISDRGCQHRQFLLASMCSPSHCVLTRWKKQASSLVSLISTLILSDQVPTLMT